MKYMTHELECALLDLAVTQALGVPARIEQLPISDVPLCIAAMESEGADEGIFSPSNNWEHAGPIIEMERIDISIGFSSNQYEVHEQLKWSARAFKRAPIRPTRKGINDASVWMRGPTPLIAAMRAYVASKLGKEVELP